MLPFRAMNLRILLLQARYEDDPCRPEERESFAEKLGLNVNQIVPYDLLEGPPSLSLVRSHDALMMGGSGDFYVSKGNLPKFRELLDLLAEVTELGHPTFCSCFGFQCLVLALGGEIVHDPENIEVGTYDLWLTDEGAKDPLFGGLPESFSAQMGRKDRAATMPSGIPGLAASERCPFQALRIPEEPIWATQFHPELDAESNRGRYLRYMEGYAEHLSPREREEAMSRFSESADAEALLPDFIELVFG